MFQYHRNNTLTDTDFRYGFYASQAFCVRVCVDLIPVSLEQTLTFRANEYRPRDTCFIHAFLM